MRVIETELPGCLVIEPKVFADARGFFFESFNLDNLAAHALCPQFVQGNVSSSSRGVLRGLHYQWPNPQGKYVCVTVGEVWDVAVDIRRGSPTFGQWTAVVLNEHNKRHFWIPQGFAHGFVTLSERAVFNYLCTATFDAQADAGVCWNDPVLAIDWPVSDPVLSEKDARAPLLMDIKTVLKYMPPEHEVIAGDIVVTSGLDLLFPPGIPAGYVSKVNRQGTGQFQYIEVIPFVDSTSIEEVLIIK